MGRSQASYKKNFNLRPSVHLWRRWASWRTRGRPGLVKEKGRKEGMKEGRREKERERERERERK
jgi:hypothetical protein